MECPIKIKNTNGTIRGARPFSKVKILHSGVGEL